jgi:hypothetical protein
MATKSKTTKRELGSVPQGEHNLVSGRKADGPGTAPAVKISTKTVKAAATNDTRPLKGKAAIKAKLQKVRSANEKAHAKRMADCTKAAEQVEPEDPKPAAKGPGRREGGSREGSCSPDPPGAPRVEVQLRGDQGRRAGGGPEVR